jgi:hypothetical protein
MTSYYLNVHYGYSTKDRPDGTSAQFENFANILVEGYKFPSDRKVKKELHLQGFAEQPIRSLGYFCYYKEAAE